MDKKIKFITKTIEEFQRLSERYDRITETLDAIKGADNGAYLYLQRRVNGFDAKVTVSGIIAALEEERDEVAKSRFHTGVAIEKMDLVLRAELWPNTADADDIVSEAQEFLAARNVTVGTE